MVSLFSPFGYLFIYFLWFISDFDVDLSSVNWLDHGRTLREQGIEETEMLLLRRKFFYSDQNVDSRDPVQLNLLYVQVYKLLILPYSHETQVLFLPSYININALATFLDLTYANFQFFFIVKSTGGDNCQHYLC